MPFYSHRRWYQPIVMGISYVHSYSFYGYLKVMSYWRSPTSKRADYEIH
jgi:hypothetical protein